MEFGYPWLLPLAVLAVPLAWLGLRRRRVAIPLATVAGLRRVRPGRRARAARAIPLVRVVAVVLLVVAVARPRVGEVEALVPAEGIDIVLTIDISSSMEFARLPDGSNRLEATRDVIRGFIADREEDRVGIVAFQRSAVPLAPPSTDYEALDRIVADLRPGLIRDGTAIGEGIGVALNMLRESDAASRVVILLTDGRHNVDSISPLEAAELARALRVRVYTVAVVQDDLPAGRREVDEELLATVAETTGGRYFRAASREDLASIYDEIGSLETSRVSGERFERYEEFGPWFAAAAGALLVAELLLRGTWLRRAPE